MRIAFVWTGVTSYMADCWRRLAAEPGVDVKVWIDTSSPIAKAVGFDVENVMRGVECRILNTEKRRCREIGEIVEWEPDFLFVVGWRSAICRAAVEDVRLKSVPKVCCFDMPWRWQLRCLAAPLVLGRFLRKYRAAFVPGAVCARYAKWLGFRKIYKGLFAINTERFRQFTKPDTLCSSAPLRLNGNAENINAGKQRNEGYFLYIGRNSAEKRLDDVRAAFRLYKEQGGTLDLKMYGKGLEGGFINPEDVPALMHGAAAFVLASDFDPWPLVLLEAMSAGCPVIASDKCTNRPELGKNWHIFKCGDVEALARELLNAEKQSSREDRCVEAKIRRAEDLELAQQYDCREWVKRVKTIITNLCSSSFNLKKSGESHTETLRTRRCQHCS